jgi:hypothetical protein
MLILMSMEERNRTRLGWLVTSSERRYSWG